MYEIHLPLQTIKQIRIDNLGISLFDAVQIPKIWCEENCNENWEKIKHLVYYFEDGTDALAFKLRWI